jgi:uncharacterized membrane protein (DUF485 family)
LSCGAPSRAASSGGPTRTRRISAVARHRSHLLAAAFAVTTLVAELAGAANLGTAMGFGQIAFAIVLLYVIVRR